MKIPDLNTEEWVQLWLAQKQQIEESLVARWYKLLTQRTVDEVCEKIVYVLWPDISVFMNQRLQLETLPRAILVKYGIVPDHNTLIYNSASPSYVPERDGENPFPWKRTNITIIWNSGGGLKILWQRYHESRVSDWQVRPVDGTAYYKNTST